MGSLSIHLQSAGASALRTIGAVALPMRVESAAWAVPVGNDLLVLVNQPGTSQTRQWRIRSHDASGFDEFESHELLPPLPVVAAGAADCGQELLVTGADGRGKAIFLGATPPGQRAWQFEINGPTPIRWPVPGCAWQPVVVWQDAHGALEVAAASAAGLSGRRSIPVGGPPLEVAVGAGAVWAAWRTATAIEVVEIREHDSRSLRVPAAFASDVAIGADAVRACVAWTQADGAFFARLGAQAAPAEPAVSLDLGRARGGRLALIAGREALVWAQRAESSEHESPAWTSSLLLPGRPPLAIDGLVHAVAWWGDRVAVVGAAEIHFLQRER